MRPACPQCDAPVFLSGAPQTKEQFLQGKDSYVCKRGHEFEALIPLKTYSRDGVLHAVRADL